MGTQRTVRNRGAQARILEYMEQHTGQPVYTDTIVKELGLPARTIQNTIGQLRDAKGFAIETISAGRAYRYRGTTAAANGKRVFEEIGTTKEGHVIIQADDGTLYRAEAL